MFQIKNQHKINQLNRAYIEIESPALGDTIAWMAYVNEFQKRFGGLTYVGCSWSDLFDYPNLTYLPNQSKNLDKYLYLNPPDHDRGYKYHMNMGNIHCPYLTAKNMWCTSVNSDGIPISLQTSAAKQLGLFDLEEKELKPKIKAVKGNRKIHEKYVCISIHASPNPQKYWNNLSGWQEVVDYLIDELGYTVVCIDKKTNYNYKDKSYDIPKRVLNKTGNIDIQDRMVDLKYADFFIGNSSGLAWLSWAVDTHVFMINGFTFPQNEFQSGCTHIYNPTVCTGCYVVGNPHGVTYFNGKDFAFRQNFHGHCPKYEILDPKKMFECTASITSELVINHIKKHTYSIGQSNP
jgi:autotransporter strand-loop-strand O-heptosyltransferase